MGCDGKTILTQVSSLNYHGMCVGGVNAVMTYPSISRMKEVAESSSIECLRRANMWRCTKEISSHTRKESAGIVSS